MQNLNKEIFIIESKMEDSSKIEKFMFIRFGCLLELLQNGHIASLPDEFKDIKIKSPMLWLYDSNGNIKEPKVKIDYDQNTNFCMYRPNLFSTNPYICIIGGYETIGGKKLYINSTGEYETYSFRLNPESITTVKENDYKSYKDNYGSKYGKTMNIYINVFRFLQIIQENKDENDKTSMFVVLKQLCDEINTTLCNITDLEPKYNEEENTLDIVDNKFILNATHDPHMKKIIKQIRNEDSEYAELPTEIVLYGGFQNKSKATTIRTFNLKSELTKEVGTTIAVGSQAGENSNTPDPSSTGFLTMNKGIIDRISPIKKHKEPKTNQAEIKKEEEENKKEIFSKLAEILEKTNTYDLFPTKEEVGNWNNTLRAFFEIYDKQFENTSNNKTLQNATPIPINLSYTMDGISGTKIFQQLNIDKTILPSSYDNVSFIIKGINHQVSNNDWTTTIETMMIPNPKDSSNYNETDTTAIQSATPVVSALTDPFNVTRPASCPTLPSLTTKSLSQKDFIALFKKEFPELSKKAIAGFIGYLMGESEIFNTNAFNAAGGGCGAYGISQWRSPRQEKLFSFITSNNFDITSHEHQIKFIRKELKSTKKNVFKLIKNNNLNLYQYTAIPHISYGLGSSNPYDYYLSINSLDTYITAYTVRGGEEVGRLTKRYQFAEQILTLL